MATFKEIAFMVNDELKLSSDDSFYELAHIYFLVDKYRSLLLRQRYIDEKKEIPEQNFQLICMPLEFSSDCLTGDELKSVHPLPTLLNIDTTSSLDVTPVGDLFGGLEMTWVSRDRLKWIGHNKWLQNIIYLAQGADKYIYVKSGNGDSSYLEAISISGVFDDPAEAAKMSCDNNAENCDIYDMQYPIENDLIPVLVGMIVKELHPDVYLPMDKDNDASDDLSGIQSK